MKRLEEIRDLINETQTRYSDTAIFKNMPIEELSEKLHDAMAYEQEINEKLTEFEKKGIDKETIHYAKVVCKNSTQKEILAIQEAYLQEVDRKYLDK